MTNLGPVSIKPGDTLYIIKAKTAVMISNRWNVLRDYATKNDNTFPGTAIIVGTGINFNLKGKMVSASDLLDWYWTFMTGNLDWPYMIVKKSEFVPR